MKRPHRIEASAVIMLDDAEVDAVADDILGKLGNKYTVTVQVVKGVEEMPGVLVAEHEDEDAKSEKEHERRYGTPGREWKGHSE